MYVQVEIKCYFLNLALACQSLKILQSRLRGRLAPPGRKAPKCVKRVKGKKGGPDKVDLLVLIDLVNITLDYDS